MPMVFEQGPYLTVAAICDKALQEKDGVISLIRTALNFQDLWVLVSGSPAVGDEWATG
jgi:hypothetical protein